MKAPLAVAVCQMASIDDWSANLQQILNQSEQALLLGLGDLLCFPENSLYMRLDKSQRVPTVELEDPIFDPLVAFAKKHNAYLYLGSVPITLNGERYNSAVILTPDGKRLAPYQK